MFVTGPVPTVAALAELDIDEARRELEALLLLPLQVARETANTVRPGGTSLFRGCMDGGRATAGRAFISAITAALSAMTKILASELTPIRVNVLAAGFVDTPGSAAMLGDSPSARHQQLVKTLPIRRVIGAGDVAALAVHLMTNPAITGTTFEIDGGQQVIRDG